MMAPIVAVPLLTVTPVPVPARVSVVAGVPEVPVFKVQLLLGLASPKMSLPTVRGASRVIVASVVRSTLLKSATASAPSATTPFNQFVVTGQLPLPGVVQ